MVFSSLFFVFLFLPLNLLIYRFMPSLKARNIVMLVFSLIFYAWGEPLYVLLLLFMTLADWFIALYIEKQEKRSAKAKLGLFAMCIVNLGLLGIFKYGGFILGNIQYFTGFPEKIPQILLPIGISFYTFQLVSYVVDVYRGEVPAQKKFWMLLLYVSLFHQCIAGPIVRYKDVCEELLERRATLRDIADGIWRFSFGLAKKAILANACGSVADTLLIENNALGLWVGMLAYALQIYLDFSAYSDMAIGMGRMIGIHYLENFDYPYISGSVTEFWRRWHISLGSFFRDYVYIPLGGNRKGRLRTYVNLFIVWFLTGLWHGASWNFVLWGLYFFVFLVIEKIGLLRVLSKSKIVSHIYLLLIVYFGWILFRFDSTDAILNTIKAMFLVGGVKFTSFETTAVVLSNMFILLFSAVVSTPIVKKIGDTLKYTYIDKKGMPVLYAVGRILIPIILLLLSTAALVGDSYNPFLYFQF
ncbi:MAG: MBOAT family protein [Clostridia bacterium]|nr:MBOAT family protein [Clostridia bacterium]